MDVLVPTNITGARLIRSSVPEATVADGTAWSAWQDYQIGAKVFSPITRRRYLAAAAGRGVDPTAETGNIRRWVDMGPTNRWAMFDARPGSSTEALGEIVVVLRPGMITSLALLEMDATRVDVTLRSASGGAVVFERSYHLEASRPSNWWEYFFMPFRPQRDLYVTGLPSYLNGELTVRISGAGVVRLGMLSVGVARHIGRALRPSTASPKSYNHEREDDFGNWDVRRRPSAKIARITTKIARADVDAVMQTMTDLLGVPCLWMPSELPGFAAFRIFGLGNGELTYDKTSLFALLSINIRGYA